MQTCHPTPTLLRLSKMRSFKNYFSALGLSVLAVSLGSAQIVTYDDEQPKISLGASPGTLEMNWFGHSGRAYFIKYSPTLDTGSWTYLPIVERGTNAMISYGANAPGAGDRFFARTVITSSASTQPRFADFDSDGVSNMDELQAGLDPLSFADSDTDGMPDDWETCYFGNLGHTGGVDSDGDGLSDLAEYIAGRHPNTSIQFGPVNFTYRGESENGDTTYMMDPEDENTLAVTYSDSAKTKVNLIEYYPGTYWSYISWGEYAPVSSYTAVAETNGSHTLEFEGHPVTQNGENRIGRDLLRKIDGMPYSRLTIGGGVTHRVAAYLAITGLPLVAITPYSFPAIIRDFPYNKGYPDFGTDKKGGSWIGLVQSNLGSDGLPVSTLAGEDGSRIIYSAASFDRWYRKPDSLSVNMGQQPGKSIDTNFPYGFNSSDYYPMTAITRDFDGYLNNFCYTTEMRGKLTYDISENSQSPTWIRVESDDDLWIFINGKLVIDRAGIDSTSADYLLRGLAHGLTTDSGVCEIQIFHAERLVQNAKLRVTTSTPLTPVYAYQFLTDNRFDSPLHYSLSSMPLAGMTLEANTGKLFWDYAGFPFGTYTVTVNVSDSKNNKSAQTLSIVLGEEPKFTAQPDDVDAPIGSTVTLSVAVTGSPAPAIQWYKDGEAITGATASVLTLIDVQVDNIAYYSARATNAISTLESRVAYLSVY